ncbi:MAG: C45 family autoproteolytic acyltransferase/hydrolase [Anaerolineae bacterium]
MSHKKLRVLDVSGSFYKMGRQHAQAYQQAIHTFTEDRIGLSTGEAWTGRNISREAVLALADACVAEHEAYAPELMDELRGMAEVTGLSLGELIINNGFTDFVDLVYAQGNTHQAKMTEQVADDCTAFLIGKEHSATGNGIFGQTWDMHATATPHVILLRGKPDNAPNFLAFTITGCIGMIGMNEHGIAVGINNLLGADGQVGVTWNFVVRKVLMQDNLDDALACITEARLAGAHNFLLMDKHGKGYNVEAMSTRNVVTPLNGQPLLHTNHCLTDYTHEVERERHANSLASSQRRLQLAQEYLAHTPITVEALMAMTRADTICVKSAPPLHSETAGAAIMQPITGDFWAVWGRPAENEYEHFTV